MRSPINEDLKPTDGAEAVSVEKQQELLLMNKLAAGGRLPPKTQSSFLQKKLQQRKFFDSGDYAMNKDQEKKHQHQPFAKTIAEGKIVPPCSLHAAPAAVPPPAVPFLAAKEKPAVVAEVPATVKPTSPISPHSPAADSSDEEEHLQIPRPENVPQRKASILHPSVHSKLSPQPHIHHEHNDDLSS